jgi:DNA helicase-2/ATP-dependent DNA helicase PcrA
MSRTIHTSPGPAERSSGGAVAAPLSGCHLQIIACAGSGKTETLALRIAHLLANDVAPESIVAFTFTEKAAGELRQRIVKRSRERCPPGILGRVGRMYVGTMHAYALRLLQTYVPRYAGYELIQEEALRAWLARHGKAILGIEEWAGQWDVMDAFLRDVDMVENEGVLPSSSDAFSSAYRAFVEMLESHRLLTVGRSIAAAADSFRASDVRRHAHKDVRFVLVDEYQDVNPAQEGFIRALAGPEAQLCVAGDDDQSIHQWRGANVVIMQKFAARYPKVGRFGLGTNMRSVPSIVELSADFVPTISPRLKKSIAGSRAQSQDAHPVRVLAPASRKQEAKEIAAGIQELMKSGWRAGQIAILIRSWNQAPLLLEALQARNILYDCSGGRGLFQTRIGYLLLSGLLIAIGWSVPHGWRQKQSQIPQPPISIKQWSRQLALLLRLSKEQRNDAETWLTGFSQEARGPGTRAASVVGDLHQLAEVIGVSRWDLDDSVQHAWFGAYARFSQVLASFERARLSGRWVRGAAGSGFVGGQDRGEWFYRELAHFLSGYALEHSDGFAPPVDPSSLAVQVITIHSAKGLQWPIVFMPGIEDGRFPSDKIGQVVTTAVPSRLISTGALARYAGLEADERRLFYVGMTRARDLLVVSCPQKVSTNRVRPSPFFEFVRTHSTAWAPPKGIGSPPKPLVAGAYDPLVPSLTFNELALYGSCPHAFRLATEFGPAAPIARDLGYSRSVHHILRRVAELVRESGNVPDAQRVEALLDSELHVPYATEVGHLEMRTAAGRLVNRYLKEWSDELKAVWEVERPFELHLDSLIIAGRADVILDQGSALGPRLRVVDYKTHDDSEPDQAAQDLLRTFAAAARAEGLDVGGAYVHSLTSATRHEIAVDDVSVLETLSRAAVSAEGILNRHYPAKPERTKCLACDYRQLCRYRG